MKWSIALLILTSFAALSAHAEMAITATPPAKKVDAIENKTANTPASDADVDEEEEADASGANVAPSVTTPSKEVTAPVSPTTTNTPTVTVPAPVTSESKAEEAAPATPAADPVPPQNELRFGLLGGISLGSTSTSTLGVNIPSNYRTGAAGGAFLEIPINESFSFMPEILYVQKGEDFPIVTSPIPGVATTFRYDVIELPLLLQGKLGNDRFKVVGFAGPSAAVAVSKSLALSVTGQNTGVIPLFSDFDIDLQIGAGTEVALTPTISWVFNTRFYAGLVNIDRSPLNNTRLNGFLFLSGFNIGF